MQRFKLLCRMGLLPLLVLAITGWLLPAAQAGEKQIVYLVSDARIPFWDILKRGVESRANALGYKVTVYSAENNAKREMELTAQAIKAKVDGIVLSPTNSSAAVTLLKLAKSAAIPVVIADIGSDGGDYVSYIASDNHEGSYQIGKVLARAMQAGEGGKAGSVGRVGSVGIIAIPQKRTNGRARTAGFMKAMDEAGIKGAGIRQQVSFSYQETYDFARELIAANADLGALWLQGSDRYPAALAAIADAGKKGQIHLVSFDAEPEFLQLIPRGTLVGAAMQQPFLMGEKAVETLHAHLMGRPVSKQILLPILPVSTQNIAKMLPEIQRNVLGMKVK